MIRRLRTIYQLLSKALNIMKKRMGVPMLATGMCPVIR